MESARSPCLLCENLKKDKDFCAKECVRLARFRKQNALESWPSMESDEVYSISSEVQKFLPYIKLDNNG